jgi:hypothetical protein
MKFQFKWFFFGIAMTATSCSIFKGSPDDRVKEFDDWRLCTELADFTFRYHSEWIWHVGKEINERGLNNDEKCRTVYTNRMTDLLKRNRISAQPLPFDEALKQ